MKQQLSPLSATICALTFHRLFEFSDYIVAIETLLPSLCLSWGCRNKLDIIWTHPPPTLGFTSGYLECTSSAAHGNLAPAAIQRHAQRQTHRGEKQWHLYGCCELLQLWMSTRILQHSSQPVPPRSLACSLSLFFLFLLLWFSVLTPSGLVLKSSPDSLMWLLSFGALRESVSEPRECKNSFGVDRKYFKKLVPESDLHQKLKKEGKKKRGTRVKQFWIQ